MGSTTNQTEESGQRKDWVERRYEGDGCVGGEWDMGVGLVLLFFLL